MNLPDYIRDHTERGECRCGKCVDVGDKPDPKHATDNGFFVVALKNDPDLPTLVQLSREHDGEFANVDPFDGKDHNYLELGAWLGSQELALRYMGLGHMLEAFNLITPKRLFGQDLPDAQAVQMAEMGMVMIVARKSAPVGETT